MYDALEKAVMTYNDCGIFVHQLKTRLRLTIKNDLLIVQMNYYILSSNTYKQNVH